MLLVAAVGFHGMLNVLIASNADAPRHDNVCFQLFVIRILLLDIIINIVMRRRHEGQRFVVVIGAGSHSALLLKGRKFGASCRCVLVLKPDWRAVFLGQLAF